MRCLELSASILEADLACLGASIAPIVDAGIHRIHVDVMDYHYVPNHALGPQVVPALRRYGIQAPMDVHLMVNPVDPWIPACIKAAPDLVYLHAQTTHHLDRIARMLKDAGIGVGIVFNPADPISDLHFLLEHLDAVLLMAVNPGFGGQKSIPSIVNKCQQLRAYLDQHAPHVLIEIDGGVQIQDLLMWRENGADRCVVGSALFSQKDPVASAKAMLSHLDQG